MKSPLNVDLFRATGKKVKDVTTKVTNKHTTMKSYVDEQTFDQTLQKRVISDKHRTLYNKVTRKFLDQKDK